MWRTLSVLSLWLVALVRASPSLKSHRILEDEAGNRYQYLDDVSGYQLKYAKCVRVKVPSNQDDDQAEGNEAFYNGRYHAQYHRYASFYLCQSSEGEQCGKCDTYTEYVTELETFLEAQIDYVQASCNACAACGRRFLEDEQEEEDEDDNYQVQVNCNTCADECQLLMNNNGNGGDETNYMECQQAYEDGDVEYYSGLQCGDGNAIIIGLFYDDECTIKTSATLDADLDYATFQTIQNFCTDCSNSNGMCDELYQEASHCVDGSNVMEDEEDMPVCKTIKSANKVRVFNKRKKSWTHHILIGLLVVAALGGILFLSYTYYVRHKNAIEKQPLSEQDHQPTTELPPIN